MLNLLNDIRIVLIEPSHPGNIGAVARSMMTMGLNQLYMIRPKKFPHYEASKRAASAESILTSAVVVDDVNEAIGDCTLVLGTSVRDREVTWPTFDPRTTARNVLQHLQAVHERVNKTAQGSTESKSKVAILFGRESSGMTNAEMDLCDSQIRIPANDDYSSLNLASAVQIIAYELRVQCLAESNGLEVQEATQLIDPSHQGVATQAQLRQRPANKAQREGYIQHLQNTLEALNFIKTKPPAMLMRKLTRLYNKAELSVEEIQILRGILSAVDSNVATLNENLDRSKDGK